MEEIEYLLMKKIVDIDRIATLSRFELTKEEKIKIKKDVEEFVDFSHCIESYDPNEAEISEKEYVGLDSMRWDLFCQSKVCIHNLSDNVKDGYFTVPITVETGEGQ